MRLLNFEDMHKFDRIEVRFPSGKEQGYNLVKLEDKFWAVDGNPGKKFFKGRISWVTKDLVQTGLLGYINKRPLVLSEYGLQNPVLEIKFYANNNLIHDFSVSRWNQAKNIAFIYDAKKDTLVIYPKDLVEWIPPDAGKFLIKAKTDGKEEDRKGKE